MAIHTIAKLILLLVPVFWIMNNSWYSKKKKNKSVICRDLVNQVVGKQKFDQRNCVSFSQNSFLVKKIFVGKLLQ